MKKRKYQIIAAVCFSIITGFYRELVPVAHNVLNSFIATVLCGVTLYFLFEISSTYRKIWQKIIVFVLGILLVVIVMVMVDLIGIKM